MVTLETPLTRGVLAIRAFGQCPMRPSQNMEFAAPRPPKCAPKGVEKINIVDFHIEMGYPSAF